MATVTVEQLFTQLRNLAKVGDYAQAQKIANKILKEIPNDIDALKCKVVCLLQQSCFSEGLDVILSLERKGILTLPFEKAYCQYRLNDLLAALSTLKAISEPGAREKELLAQVLYRLEDYTDCLDIYKDLIKNSQDDFGDEREANMLAVVAAAKFWKQAEIGGVSDKADTFELCYNYACLLIARGDLQGAQAKLEKAEELCRKSLLEDPDLTEDEVQEEIDSELGVIRAQMAYIKQLKGKTDESLHIYQQVLKTIKSKPSDADTLAAVVSNNIVTINKDKDVFDSKKKLKIMSADGLEHKLSEKQLELIEMNKGLLNLYSNQIDACKKNVAKLKDSYIATEKSALLQAAMLIRDKHPDQAIKSMKEMIDTSNASSEMQLALSQLYLSRGKNKEAGEMLQSIKELQNTPAMVSFLVGLLSHMDDIDSAIRVLDNAVANAEKEGHRENLLKLMRENANYKMRRGLTKQALSMLEKLRSEDSKDLKILAKIIAAYSEINPKKAEEYSESLPPFAHDDDVDVDALESKHLMGNVKFSKKAQAETKMESQEQRDEVIKKKRKKKRKPRLPKSYNPDIDPDPERWLPRWERSTFKHKKQKRGQISRGPQGSVAADTPTSPSARQVAAASVSPVASPQPGASASATVVPPRQQKPQAAKAKPKKKKKGGW